MKNHYLLRVLCLLLTLGGLSRPGQAQTFAVANTGDAGTGSLRQAMLDLAASGSAGPFTITATTISGTINLASALPGITKNVTFVGPGASTLTVRRSSGASANFRIFTITSTASFNGFTVADGLAMAAPSDGGAIDNTGVLTISNCAFRNNRAAFVGGAIQNRGQLTVENCLFAGNSCISGTGAGSGGGIGHKGSLLSVSNTIFSSNSAVDGSGVHVDENTATITNCLFTDNEAIFGGGLMFRTPVAGSVVTNCTFSSNRTTSSGSAINCVQGSQTFVNTTITSNTGTNGALHAVSGATPVLINCIVAGNTATGDDNISGSVDASSSFNVIGPDGSGGLTNGVNNNRVGVTNALLSSLGNHGGPFHTHALLPGSPAINAGTATGTPTTDQRGISRVGATDVGSFESRGFTLALNGGSNQSATVSTAFANSLAIGVSSAFSEPVNGGEVTYTGPGSGAGINPASVTATIAGGVASASVTANAAAGGPYTVAATANGASPTINFGLTNTSSAPAIVGFNTVDNTVCVGSPITFTATVSNVTTPYNFTLTNGSGPLTGTSSTTVFSQSLTASGSGGQSFTLTVSSGGQSGTATTSVTVNALPIASLENNGPLSCAVTSVTLTATGGTSYSFSAGASQVGGNTGNTATVSSAGAYSVIVTATNGCTATATTTVSQDTNVPTVTITANPSLTITQGQSATLTASVTGGGELPAFVWSDGQTTSAISVSTAGPYSVTVTGDNGCSAVASVVVSVTAAPVVSGPFAITGVVLIDCTPINQHRRVISFNPQYVGVNGQPISFSVVNELLPTTSPGPHSLQMYVDNPAITLKAVQSGVMATFVFNWLAACNNGVTPPPVNTAPTVANAVGPQSATVGQALTLNIASTFTDAETPNALVVTASGLPAGLTLTGTLITGTPSVTGTSTVILRATDPGSLSVSTSFGWTVSPVSSTTISPPPPPVVFSITGVSLVDCTPINQHRRAISFDPQYAGVNGQPISFSVVNELLPTTSPGPHSLQMYVDNPVITLKAVQSGVMATFVFNWLAACNSSGGRLGVDTPAAWQAILLGNPVVGGTVEVEVRGAAGQRLHLELINEQGYSISRADQASAAGVERFRLRVGPLAGVYVLRVSSPLQSQTLKVVKP